MVGFALVVSGHAAVSDLLPVSNLGLWISVEANTTTFFAAASVTLFNREYCRYSTTTLLIVVVQIGTWM